MTPLPGLHAGQRSCVEKRLYQALGAIMATCWYRHHAHNGKRCSGQANIERDPSPAISAATARAATGVTLHAGAVAHERVVAALTTGFTLIALHLGFGPGVHRDCAG